MIPFKELLLIGAHFICSQVGRGKKSIQLECKNMQESLIVRILVELLPYSRKPFFEPFIANDLSDLLAEQTDLLLCYIFVKTKKSV